MHINFSDWYISSTLYNKSLKIPKR